MPGRNLLGPEGYRYAFQGQERDPETGKEAFELRLWDSRIGRWLSPDPKRGKYLSPYWGMNNNPISKFDPDGADPDWYEDENGDRVYDSRVTSQADLKNLGIKGTYIGKAFYNPDTGDFGFANGVFRNYRTGEYYSFMDEVTVTGSIVPTYNLNQEFTYHKRGISAGASSWSKIGSTFRPSGNGAKTLYGYITANAEVTFENNQYILTVEGFAYTQNDPATKINGFLNYKAALDETPRLATASIPLRAINTYIVPGGTTYVGGARVVLPYNPNELSSLSIQISVFKSSGANHLGVGLNQNILNDIVK